MLTVMETYQEEMSSTCNIQKSYQSLYIAECLFLD